MTERSRFASLEDDDNLKIINVIIHYCDKWSNRIGHKLLQFILLMTTTRKLPKMRYQLPLEFCMNICRWKID